MLDMAAQPFEAVSDSDIRTDLVAQRTQAMFTDCLHSFHAFGALTELAENLRILSLNAELAAGRAGDKGRAVRALTQYTRELVNRLKQIETETSLLMSRTYEQIAMIMRELHQIRLLEQAIRELRRASTTAQPTVHKARQGLLKPLVENANALLDGVERLTARAHVVGEVVSAAASIATNIAIEAAGAGVHEAEFRNVADTMRRYVIELRDMTDKAASAARSAATKGDDLRGLRLNTGQTS
ncbi:MAG: chemotaxis protein [Rhodospirillales bacterium]|nr:chemotaxis protein [Rhodospirillales bacterium]